MKRTILLKIFLSLLFIFVGLYSYQAQARALTTVPYVDLTRYMGTWYEIASIPQYFQRKCVSDTTANYEILSKHSIRVYNSCVTPDRSRIASEGRAKVEDTTSNAKLKVTFAHLGSNYLYLFSGKYWIIDLESNYRYAIVGHPNRNYGWILSRDPFLSDSRLLELAHVLVDKGYDTCKFMITPQTGGLTAKARLCDIVRP